MNDVQLIQTPCVFGENGNFLLERELGKGGMGGVYMGRDKMLDRPVAVKVMLKEYGTDAEFVERFKKEAQAAARLIHPNIAQIYSYGIADGMPYIAMELVAGGSLDAIMRNSGGASDIARIMKICEQVAQALRCAADQGLVHGDVKPENVLLDANGNAKLVDFGLAAMQNNTDEIWGTPYYIAPEKVRKEVVDYRADMYSLGGTVYHALCGIPPFDGEDASAVVRKRFDYLPRRPSEIRPELTPQIDALVMKMLAFDPADRYPTFEALLADWSAVLTMGISASQVLNPIPSAAPAASAAKPASGKKRLMIKPKRTLTVRPQASASEDSADAELTDEKPNLRSRSKNLSNGGSAEEEEEGSLGGKVAMVIGGILGAILLVGGGLWLLSEKNKSDNEARRLGAIQKQIDVDKAALSDFRRVVRNISTEATNVVKSLTSEAESTHAKIVKLFSEDYSAEILEGMRAPKTKRLLAAEKALLPPAPPPAEGAATEGKKAEVSEEKKAEIAKAAVEAGLKFRAPEGDEADPMSPEGQKYLEEKKKWEEEKKAKDEAKAKEAEASAEDAAEATSSVEGPVEAPKIPDVVGKMKDLWVRVHDAVAMQLEMDRVLNKLLEEIEKGEGYCACDESVKQSLMLLVSHCKTTCDADGNAKLKELKTEVAKIKNALKQLYKDEAAKLADAKARERQLKEAADRAKAREEEEKRKAEERAAKIAAEIAAAKEKFDALVVSGKFRQLDWAGAKRELEALEKSFETAEGRQRLRTVEMKKVDMMKSVQDIFIRNMKNGYVFKAQLCNKRGMKVVSVDANKIMVEESDGKGRPSTIMWQTFYSKNHSAWSELWNKFIRKGRIMGNPKLSLKQYAEAQLGFALTMKLVCPDADGAMGVAKLSALEAVKCLPQYKALAEEAFSGDEIDFSTIEAEAAANQL